MPARTVSAILRRHQVPYLADCDPLTGEVIRASRRTRVRYERPAPGDLVHIDVKKIGRIPTGGGWRARGRAERPNHKRGLGYDYVHAAVDDHSRLAYAEVLDDEKGTTCAGFLLRAGQFFACHGVQIRQVLSDNTKNYVRSADFQATLAALGAQHLTIRAYSPWQNGKVERFNRTLQVEWAYRQVFTSNAERTAALDPGSSTTTLDATTQPSEATESLSRQGSIVRSGPPGESDRPMRAGPPRGATGARP